MKPLNIRDPFFVLAIVALSFFWYGTCQSNKVDKLKAENESRISQDRIQEMEETGLQVQVRLNELQADRIRIRDSAKVELRARNEVIQQHKKTIARLRPQLQPKLDSFPDLREFVTLQDSVIVAQDTLINRMQLAHAAEIVNLESQLKESGRLVMIEAAKGDLWRQSAESTQKDVRKEVRRKTFWKITSGILAGGIVYLSLRE